MYTPFNLDFFVSFIRISLNETRIPIKKLEKNSLKKYYVKFFLKSWEYLYGILIYEE